MNLCIVRRSLSDTERENFGHGQMSQTVIGVRIGPPEPLTSDCVRILVIRQNVATFFSLKLTTTVTLATWSSGFCAWTQPQIASLNCH